MGADISGTNQAMFGGSTQSHGQGIRDRAPGDRPVLPQKSRTWREELQIRSRHADPAIRRKSEPKHPLPSTICGWLLWAERQKRTRRLLGSKPTNS